VHFGFWILDCGLKELILGFNPKSKIQNPKCPSRELCTLVRL